MMAESSLSSIPAPRPGRVGVNADHGTGRIDMVNVGSQSVVSSCGRAWIIDDDEAAVWIPDVAMHVVIRVD